MLLHDGEKSESIVIMHEGSAKALNIPLMEGNRFYMYFLRGFFGEQNLLSNRLATYSVEALTPVKTCILQRTNFINCYISIRILQ